MKIYSENILATYFMALELLNLSSKPAIILVRKKSNFGQDFELFSTKETVALHRFRGTKSRMVVVTKYY